VLLVECFAFPAAHDTHLDARDILSLEAKINIVGHRDRREPRVKIEILWWTLSSTIPRSSRPGFEIKFVGSASATGSGIAPHPRAQIDYSRKLVSSEKEIGRDS
jgi:hypothetical protein